ncbi:UTRA domain-containing protein [Streptomyces sp. NPDC007875]|uniref:UTRA domain-containing protein n=1 Tax=Streptomyces sp. NPDC007875 TaxID=3364783 RepID=UPI0036A17414
MRPVPGRRFARQGASRSGDQFGVTAVLRLVLVDVADALVADLELGGIEAAGDSYYPAQIAAGTGLAGTAKIRGGAVALLAELGHVGRRVREDVTARMPGAQERELLRTGAEEPVLCLERVVLDGADRAIQADLITMPAQRQRLRYELRMG